MNDEYFMKRCFDLAERGIGKVSPNPLVGAVIVKDGKIISEAWHEEYGKAHAEANAINRSETDVSGATLFCNLEPCCHTKKQTPPCTPLIISSKIKRVVISNQDPNPQVSGKGVEALKDAGLEVTTGILEKEGMYLNRFYMTGTSEEKPFVTIKIAQSIDGKITDEINKRKQITGHDAMKFVHGKRAEYDAVLIGANTVLIDDPKLDVRFAEGRNPIRIILDNGMIVPREPAVFNYDDGRTWLVTAADTDTARLNELKEKGIRIITLPVRADGQFDLNYLLKHLGSLKINSLLIEGGAAVFSSFIGAGLFDDLILLQAPVIFGKGLNSVSLDAPVRLETKSIEKLGDDIKIDLINKKSPFFQCYLAP